MSPGFDSDDISVCNMSRFDCDVNKDVLYCEIKAHPCQTSSQIFLQLCGIVKGRVLAMVRKIVLFALEKTQ